MAVDLSSLDPRLADAVRRGRRALPGRVRPATDSENWPAEAQAVVRRSFRDGSFRAAIDEIEASSPDLALEQVLVLDDALLLATLAGVAPPELLAARRDGALATTSSWLYRLSRAIEDRSREGSLGRAFARLPAEARVRVTDDLADLPEPIGLLPTRALVPAMALLSVEHRLNFLTSEALAAAVLLDGAICVSTQSDLLDRAAASLHLDVRHLSPT